MNRFTLYLLTGLYIAVFAIPVCAQENDWKLKKQTDQLKVYYRQQPTSKLKELKMSTTFEAKLSTIVAVLRDVDAFPEWIYGCRKAQVLKSVSHLRYVYAQMNFPWPLSDRDYYAQTTLIQDPTTRVVTSRMQALPQYAPEQDGHIRIPQMEVTWIFTPIDDETVHLDYLLRSDPGGMLPSWLINMALDKGPTKSLERFREMLRLKKYKNQTFAYIQN